MKLISKNLCFGGEQLVYEHQSPTTRTPMTFAIFMPPQAKEKAVPVLFYLSGLTCTHDNVTVKAGAQRKAAELGIAFVAPDTSPRGDDVADVPDDYSMGKGAGFYVDATESPWDRNYRMYSYITEELPALLFANFSADRQRQGITGHSMGGHGALTIAMKNPHRFKSVSAFAPICGPSFVNWGQKALTAYLGADQKNWADYDASVLVAARGFPGKILIDQGTADNFLENELRPDLFENAAKEAGQDYELRMQEGYDHSYYFMASFIDDHIEHHATILGAN
ncbi:MAG: S-formylglutathione hydrolase [Alphaproteobacteria bacterium]